MERDNGVATILKQALDTIQVLANTIKDMEPTSAFGEAVMADSKFWSMKEAADVIAESVLSEGGQSIGRNTLFKTLRDIGILSSSDSNWNLPYRQFIDQGYFQVKAKETPVGMTSVTLVTGKGLQYIQRKVMEYVTC